jgi:hypothetical protein
MNKQWVHDHPTASLKGPPKDDATQKRLEDKILKTADLEPLHHPGHHDEESDAYGARQWGHDHPTTLLKGLPKDDPTGKHQLERILGTADIEPLHHHRG